MGTFLYIVVIGLLWLLFWSLFAAAIFSWLVAFDVVNYRNPFVRQLGAFLDAVTRPILAPLRKVLPSFGGVDISPIVAGLVILGLIKGIAPLIFGPLIATIG
jgi:YggT family protein